MTTRSKWLNLAISLGVMLSLVLMTVATASAARSGSRSHGKAHNKSHAKAAKCKKVKASGTIRFSDNQFPDNLSQFQSQSAVSSEVYTLMWTGLYAYDQSAHFVPTGLAKFPTVQNGLVKNGGRTIILKLKSNMHWNNGQAETSADIKFGWRVGSDKASGPACTGTCDAIGSIDLPNKTTAVLHLKRVYAPAVPDAFPPVLPVSWSGGWKKGDAHTAAKKLYLDTSWNYESGKFPMDGPYVPSEFVNSNRITLVQNKHFRLNNTCGTPTSRYQFAFYSDPQTEIDAASTGATDLSLDYTEANLPSLSHGASAHHKFKVSSVPSFTYEHLELNHDAKYNGQKNPFHDVRVRQAVALALTKTDIIRGAQGVSLSYARSVVANSPWLIAHGVVQPFANRSINGVWDPIRKRFVQGGSGQAVKDAKTLLKRAGYAHGFSFDHYTTTAQHRRNAAAIMAAQLRSRLGLTMNLHFVPATSVLFATWQENGVLVHGTFQSAEFAWVGSPDSDTWKFQMQCKHIARHSSTPGDTLHRNDAGICNKTVDSDFAKAAGTLNNSARAKYYGQIQSLLSKNADWIGLYYRSEIVTVGTKVHNFKNTPVGSQMPVWNWWQLRKAA